jgi:hypothetical protein
MLEGRGKIGYQNDGDKGKLDGEAERKGEVARDGKSWQGGARLGIREICRIGTDEIVKWRQWLICPRSQTAFISYANQDFGEQWVL